MATIASNVAWGSGPTNTFDFSYEKKREGTTQYYKITVSCDPCTGASYFGYPIYFDIKLDGITMASRSLKSASPSQWSSALSYTAGWLKVANKTSGTTALKIRIYSGSGSTRDTTYSYSLPVDPAISTIGATNTSIESVSTISVAKYDDNFTTTVAYKAAGQTAYTTIWTKQKHTSYPWTVPSSLYALIPNGKKIAIDLRCQTYNGDILLGENSCTMTATTSESKCTPSVSVTAIDTNASTISLTGSNKRIILGYSDIQVVTSATAKNSASISSIVAKCGVEQKTGANVTFTGAESTSISTTATDSRGYSKTAIPTGFVSIGYIDPTIKETISRESPTSDKVNISVNGKWFPGNFGSVANTLRVQVRYKPKGQSAYTDSDKYIDMAVTTNGGTYSATLSLTGLSYTEAYSIRIRASDAIHVYGGALAEPVYRNVEISKGIPVFDWGENDFRFNVPLYSGGVNFTQIYQAESGAAGLGQGESTAIKNPTDNHRLYYVRPTISDGVSPANVYIPCGRLGDRLIGVGGFPHTSGRMDLFSVQLLLSGDTVTLEYCGYWNTATQEYSQRKVHGIFAVL